VLYDVISRLDTIGANGAKFYTVGLVIWPIKIVPDVTYNVFGGTPQWADVMKQDLDID